MSLIKVVDIAHVRFSAPDLAQMQGFLDDFGLTTFKQDGRLYARARDGRPFVHVTEQGDPGFLAFGFRAASVEDLDILAKAEGVAVEDTLEPGGGRVVRLTDPDGFRVEVVAGQAQTPCEGGPVDLPRNTAAHRNRLRETVRLTAGPAHVRRIGHGVLNVSDFRTSEAWYKERFGFLTSDEVEAAKDVPLGAFMGAVRQTLTSLQSAIRFG
ncbi:hypothetical protein RXV95_06275 [Novosphingobium sp. ZN18A2]|uniref:hypothetical protein n=1 Tax=Novosphingobium sp. ZN18A2 TaxID=3079861 RepID=UPI0030D3AC0F